MGMYDTVTMVCPACGLTTTWQSKAHECNLNVWPIEKAPAVVVGDVEWDGDIGKLECDHCGAKLRLDVQRMVSVRTVTDGGH